MKALKIVLLLALFVVISSQTDKKTADSADTHQTSKMHYDLLAHSRLKIQTPPNG